MEKKLKNISVHLLDLGKRNRLLNYKDTGFRTIEVLNGNISNLFNKITSSVTLNIFNLDPILTKYNKVIDGTGEKITDYTNAKVKDITSDVLKANDVLCYKQGNTLSKVFKIIYREYKQTLLEKGINTLYMTFGLVEYVSKKDKFLAPLLLIPLNCDLDNTYKIKEYDDEIIVNPTLAYLLKNEYKIDLDPYIDKESIYDDYMKKMQIKLNEKGLDLHQHVSIGIYSFLKMNMFEDITNNKDIVLKNKNILRLLDQPIENDNLVSSDIYPVVEADSSQVKAIEYATSGASFVLQGPPGSGKSQTITNIIASVIGNGKKVLFVSEKQAALNVVYDNLKKAGLDSFALELHSHKASKKEFIDELYRTATLPRYDIKDSAYNSLNKHKYLNGKLEDYRSALHNPISRLNLSIYEIYSRFLTLNACPFTYKINKIEELDYEYLDNVKSLLNKYSLLSKTLSYDYHEGTFYGFVEKDLNYLRFEAKESLEELKNFINNKNDIKNIINENLPLNLISYSDLLNNIDIVSRFVELNFFMPDYFNKRKRAFLLNNLERYLKANEYLEKSTIKNFINLDILNANPTKLLYDFKARCSSKFKWFTPSYYKIKKEINLYTNVKMKDSDLLSKLEEVCTYKLNLEERKEALEALPKDYRPYEYELIYKDLLSLEKIPFDLNITEDRYFELKELFTNILMNFKENNSLNLSQYINKFDSSVIDLIKGDLEYNTNRLNEMITYIELLDLHVERLNIIDKLTELKVINYLDKCLKSGIDLDKITSYYEYLFMQGNIYYEINSNPILKEFSGLGVDSIIEEFKELDKVHLETNKAMIVSKLSKLRPDDSIMSGTKFSILVREYNKSRKQKPIRVLLEEIFDLVLDIKPVFLMSPLSVSTYLNSALDMFDLVIFDEASQVFAWDALGAIYRAKQCIIIGDSKQMPPSNFFNTTLNEEEVEDEYSQDLESILDKGSSVLPTKRLSWHYRSRSEELIAFSNREFYESRLITIPQAKSHEEGFGIDFYYLNDGIYEVKSRTNQREAEYICDLVFNHFDTKPKQSLGVVAFSNSQSELIMGLIDERLDREPQYKKFFDDEVDEPFFVKNLESVQGDERDRIIFSICYGYNKDNKFYQRFGPLNNLGGERRLNVAITRAKYNICVVSSIKSKDIRIENTESVGVKLLKRYLDYIENVTVPKHSTDVDIDGVINNVYDYLTSQGFLVQKRIGTSSFKIDLAVMHPITKEYVVAIMLDGESYKIGSCSDVNRLQQILLNRLGWNYYRLFSTLWINQMKLEKEKLINYLNQVFNNQLPKHKEKVIKKTFLVEDEEIFDDSFEKYNYVTEEKIRELYNKKTPAQIIKYVVDKEEPINVDYLLKRICFMYGRTKVTNVVRDLFNKDLETLDLIYENNYLMTKHPQDMSLRIPSDRMIEQIHTKELEDAIYKVVKKSNGITKEGCFKAVVKLLGYNRMSENAVKCLEDSLIYLKLNGKIVEKQDCLYV